MLKPIKEEELLKAIHRLQFNEDYKLLQEYLVRELARLRADNDQAGGVQLCWQQGACQVLADILMQDETVRESIQRLSQSEPGKPRRRHI